MKSFEKKKSENEHFHDRSVVRTRPPPIFGFILTSRIPQNTSQLRGKEDTEREREREREREEEREKKKEKSARDFYYRVVDLVVVVVVSSFVFFPLRLRVVLRKRTKREDKNHDDEKSFKKR